MQTEITIKNITIGNGRPVICLPVVSHTKKEIINEIKQYVKLGAQMIEWRVDYFDEVLSDRAVCEVLEAIKKDVIKTIMLFTFRSYKQGGSMNLDEEKIMHLNEIAAGSDVIDIIDLEYFEATNPKKAISHLQQYGVKVIASHHDFEKTPENQIIQMILRDMKQGGADIVKFAAYPKDEFDVLRLLYQNALLKKEFPHLPIVTMTMGKVGSVSRVCGETFGSCITFGAGKGQSAPGQIGFEQLKTVLEIIHESYGE
ncbi:type I 3-dehydroquinate dehydratase [Eubacterium oxidoreducens]|uniref:3-dehydroquinate dehydratase n=1 Tax=Eubacterium oxidoreducens TaxID=1732 RepID=A0A1G6AJV6_EUBOX|nr:type I 3-dehydroquinate dehydratase [Eubacterium oxidoreducens]SDB08590.1 3-dehydroquinate dehydratase [Eubacterium oxidoreducens]